MVPELEFKNILGKVVLFNRGYLWIVHVYDSEGRVFYAERDSYYEALSLYNKQVESLL